MSRTFIYTPTGVYKSARILCDAVVYLYFAILFFSIFFSVLFMIEVSLNVLVSTTTNRKHNDVIRIKLHLFKRSQSMGTLKCRDDTLKAGQLISCIYSLVVIDGQYCGTVLSGKVRVHRSDARVVKSCR